jgi:hypothetical protein
MFRFLRRDWLFSSNNWRFDRTISVTQWKIHQGVPILSEMKSAADPPIFFAKPAAFRAWLEKNHEVKREQWVGFHRKASGRPSITWPEAVDEALCFGWIDGLRKTVATGARSTLLE